MEQVWFKSGYQITFSTKSRWLYYQEIQSDFATVVQSKETRLTIEDKQAVDFTFSEENLITYPSKVSIKI